jgi:toxin ParE1/3/4
VIRFSAGAARELEADRRRYERQLPGRGRRFVAAIDAALARVAEAPHTFPVMRPPDIRSAKVQRFPYRVVFIVLESHVHILAVAHGRRRPGYWRRRLET